MMNALRRGETDVEITSRVRAWVSIGPFMKLILGPGVFLLAALLSGCSGEATCARGDWCACSGGTECYQDCDGDGNGCRFFCGEMDRCGSVCGDECNVDCHFANECSAYCDDHCSFSCNDSLSCGLVCGANCSFTCFNMQSCGVRAGPGSMIGCFAAASCVVECLGDCRVFCTDEVDRCEVSCPDGVSPISCADGALACGSC